MASLVVRHKFHPIEWASYPLRWLVALISFAPLLYQYILNYQAVQEIITARKAVTLHQVAASQEQEMETSHLAVINLLYLK